MKVSNQKPEESNTTSGLKHLLPIYLATQVIAVLLLGYVQWSGLGRSFEEPVQKFTFMMRQPAQDNKARVIGLRATPEGTYKSSREELVNLLEAITELPQSNRPDAIAIDLLLYSPPPDQGQPLIDRLSQAQMKLGNVVQAYAVAFESQPTSAGYKPQDYLVDLIDSSRIEGSPALASMFSTIYPANPAVAGKVYETAALLGFVNMLPEDRKKNIGLLSLPMISTWNPSTLNSKGQVIGGGERTYQSLSLAAAAVVQCTKQKAADCLRFRGGKLLLHRQNSAPLSVPSTLPINHRPYPSHPLDSALSGSLYTYSSQSGRLNSLTDASCVSLKANLDPGNQAHAEVILDKNETAERSCVSNPDLSGLVLVVVDGRERQSVSDPLNRRFPGSIHAAAIDDLLSGDLIQYSPKWLVWIMALLTSSLAFALRVWVMRRDRPNTYRLLKVWSLCATTPIIELTIGLSCLMANFAALEQWSLWTHPIAPALAPLANWVGWNGLFRTWLRVDEYQARNTHKKLKMARQDLGSVQAILANRARENSPLILQQQWEFDDEQVDSQDDDAQLRQRNGERSKVSQDFHTRLLSAITPAGIQISELPTKFEIQQSSLLDWEKKNILQQHQTLSSISETIGSLSHAVEKSRQHQLLEEVRDQQQSFERQQLKSDLLDLNSQGDVQQELKETKQLQQAREHGALAIKELKEVDIIMTSPVEAYQLLNEIKKSCQFNFVTVISGETGTGKELVAKAIHKCGTRSKQAFIPINCAGLRGDLAYSALFGHIKGSFTGAISDHPGAFKSANNGVLFLDEIHHLDADIQTSLLRVLQDWNVTALGDTTASKVDVHLVVATNVDIFALSTDGQLKHDLLARLRGCSIHLAPLKDRPSDIGPLILHFLKVFSNKTNISAIEMEKSALTELTTWQWPDNIRGLQRFTEQLAAELLMQPQAKQSLVIKLEHIANVSQQPAFKHYRTGSDAIFGAEAQPCTTIESDDRRVFGARLASRLPVYRRGEFRWSQIQYIRVKGGESCPQSKGTFYKDLHKSWFKAIIAAQGHSDLITEYLCRDERNSGLRDEQLNKLTSKWSKLMDVAQKWKDLSIDEAKTSSQSPIEAEHLSQALMSEVHNDASGAKLAAELVILTWAGKLPDPRRNSATIIVD